VIVGVHFNHKRGCVVNWIRFVCGCLVVSLTASASPQSAVLPEGQAARIKLEVQKRGAGENSRVRVTLKDDAEVKGYISRIDADTFQVTDKKTGSATTLEYREVLKVRGGGMSKGAKIALVAAGGLGAAIAISLGRLAASGE
jgi:hypothetical protein